MFRYAEDIHIQHNASMFDFFIPLCNGSAASKCIQTMNCGFCTKQMFWKISRCWYTLDRYDPWQSFNDLMTSFFKSVISFSFHLEKTTCISMRIYTTFFWLSFSLEYSVMWCYRIRLYEKENSPEVFKFFLGWESSDTVRAVSFLHHRGALIFSMVSRVSRFHFITGNRVREFLFFTWMENQK